MNEQNNNSNGHVKSKFFNQELLDEANVSDVGSATSGQVISWGVGGKWNGNDKLDSTQMFNFVNSDFTGVEVLLEDNVYVNDNSHNQTFDEKQISQSISGQDVISPNQQNNFTTDVQDIIGTAKLDSSSNRVVSNEFIQNNPAFVGYNTNEMNNSSSQNIIDNNQVGNDIQNVFTEPMQQESNNTIEVSSFDPFNSTAEPIQNIAPAFQTPSDISNGNDLSTQQNTPFVMMAAESKNNSETFVTPANFSSGDGVIDENTRLNQPLSMVALSGESIDESQRPKDVIENAKYFQDQPSEKNRKNVDDIIAIPVPAVDVLAEPARDVNVLKLTKFFVGEKYQKISMSPFSFCGGFFGALYFFFRKMYLYGFVLSIINLIAMILTIENVALGLGLTIGEFIVVGLLTNSLYLNFVDNEVKKIVIDNPKMSQHELQSVCIKKGGTNLLLAILINWGLNIISGLILTLIFGSTIISSIFDGQKILITDKSIDINELVEYVIPTEFVVDKNQNLSNVVYEEVKVKGEKMNIAACAFDINVIAGYSTSSDLVRYMADTDKRYNKIGSYNTEAGEKWDTYEFEGQDGMEIYRARMFDGHIVLVSYFINNYATDGMCELHLENIMNSIKEK